MVEPEGDAAAADSAEPEPNPDVAAAPAQPQAEAEYPLQWVDAGDREETVAEFNCDWIHTTAARDATLKGGWRPDLLANTKYGAAIYLTKAPARWVLDGQTRDASDDFHCRIIVAPARSRAKICQDGAHELCPLGCLTAYLKACKVIKHGVATGPSSSAPNARIAKHFLDSNVDVVRVNEHGIEIAIVYNPACLRVIRRAPTVDGSA